MGGLLLNGPLLEESGQAIHLASWRPDHQRLDRRAGVHLVLDPITGTHNPHHAGRQHVRFAIDDVVEFAGEDVEDLYRTMQVPLAERRRPRRKRDLADLYFGSPPDCWIRPGS